MQFFALQMFAYYGRSYITEFSEFDVQLSIISIGLSGKLCI